MCNKIADRDEALLQVITRFGYPPLWYRPPTFESIIHFILEQQVSLASALAALQKLKAKTGAITASAVIDLTDEELRACYFSRQKIIYARSLARAVIDGSLVLADLPSMDNLAIRQSLTSIKGIGEWTADVFTMICLNRCDVWPVKDVALLRSVCSLKLIAADKTALLHTGDVYKPYRTIAAYLFWHAYIQSKKLKIKIAPGQ